MSMPTSLQSSFENPDESPGLVLWRVTNAWQAAQRRTLKPFDLTHVQFVLLASLTWFDSDTPTTQQDLADYARTDPMMTSQVLRALERAGHVLRLPHPDDGRAKVLSVTPSGRAIANRAVVAIDECDRDFFAALGSRLGQFTGMLATLSP